MIPKSIRWRLPLSYAAIALIAALALGLVLLVTLRSYYLQRELDYLQGNAQAVSLALAPLLEEGLPMAAVESQLSAISFLSQTQVRLLDPSQQVLADSGSPEIRQNLISLSLNLSVETEDGQQQLHSILGSRPDETEAIFKSLILIGDEVGDEAIIDQEEIVESPGSPESPESPESSESMVTTETIITSTNRVRAGLLEVTEDVDIQQTVQQEPISILSAVGTPYGFGLNLDGHTPAAGLRSDQIVIYPIRSERGGLNGYIELSNGPAYGRDVLASVAWGWAIASTVAVLLAAAIGWLISRRLSKPLLELTEVTGTMAGGDLSIRTPIDRDDEVGSLANAFNEMANQIEGTVTTLRRFVADAAHELNTPLTALRTNLELSSMEQEPVQHELFLARALTQVTRLEALSQGLLDLSRLESGAATPLYQLIDFGDLVRDLSEPYASQADQQGITFSLNLPEEATLVRGDDTRLRQAAGNLLDNALKFTPPQGSIKVTVKPESQMVELIVADTGIGIPAEDLPQLFSRFHRGRNSADYPGSGLGLAIVKAIADSHGGTVAAHSAEGRTQFVMHLPRL